MKRTVCILLLICLGAGLIGCGSGGYGVKTVQTLVEQEYSLAFRTGDTVATYMAATIELLKYEGKVDELAIKWFGDRIIDFDSDPDALAELPPAQPRELILGVDANSFPMAYMTNGEYWGFDVELAYVVCERLGWTLKIQPIEKENVFIELSSGNIDCAWGGVMVDPAEVEAGHFYQYGPYVENDIVIAARNGGNVWNRLMLSGKALAMPSTPEALEALSVDAKLPNRLGQVTRLAGGTMECFEYLYSGKCDVVLTDTTALAYYNCH